MNQDEDEWRTAVSFTEAAERLGVSFNEAFADVITRRLRVVHNPNGRPLVPMQAIEERLRDRADSAV